MSRILRSEPARTGRIPVSSNRAPLLTKGLDRENFYYRFVIDRDDRIAKFLLGGYDFVQKSEIKGVVGEPTVDSSKDLDTRVTKPCGRGFKYYLMKLPLELYNEDQEAKHQETLAIEDATKGKSKEDRPDYGTITIERGKEI